MCIRDSHRRAPSLPLAYPHLELAHRNVTNSSRLSSIENSLIHHNPFCTSGLVTRCIPRPLMLEARMNEAFGDRWAAILKPVRSILKPPFPATHSSYTSRVFA